MDVAGAEALLRASTAADPSYFPAHYVYIRHMRATAQTDRLRRDYAGPGDGSALGACLRVVARAPSLHLGEVEDALAALHARAPTPCTTVFGAARTGQPWQVERWRAAVRAAPEIAELWGEYSVSLVHAGRPDQAERAVREGIRRVPHVMDRITLYLHLMSSGLESGDTASALALHRALRMAVQRDGRPGVRAAYLRHVAVTPDWPASGTTAEQARREMAGLARAHGAWQWEWNATFDAAGTRLDWGGDPRGAIPLYDRAVQLADSLRLPVLQVQAYLKRGRAYAKGGRLAEAERDLLHALALARGAGEPFQWAEVYHNLAHVYEGAGRWDDAVRAARRFVELTVPLRGAGLRMMALHDSGIILWKAGQHAAAHAAFTRMVGVVDELGIHHYWAGEHFERMGDLDRARVYYRRSLAEPVGESSLALAGLVRVFEALGMPDSAEAAAVEHARVRSMIFDVPMLPGVLARRGRTDEAVRISRAWADQRLRTGNVQTAAATLLQSAGLLLSAGRPRDALADALRADSLAARLNLTAEHIQAARLAGLARLRLGETDAGLALLRRAARLAGAHPTTDGVLLTHLALGDALADAGRGAEALAAYDRAAVAVEQVTARLGADLDRARYRDRHLAPFDGALRLLLRDPGAGGRLDALLHWSQRRKGAALALATGTPGDGAAPRSLRQVQRALGPRDALLDYVVADSAAAVLVVTPRRAALVRLPASPSALRRWAQALRRPLVTAHAGRVDLARAPYDLRTARALHGALLAPAAPLLDGVQRLAVVPDGPLHHVPFEALVTAPPADGDYRRAAYLIDRYQVVYLPSAQRAGSRGDGRVQGPLLAVALGAPGAEREAAAIRAAWPAGRTRVLTDGEATETAVRRRAGGRAVLHFAVHARADDADPLASYLRLGADGENDGLLHLAEIAGERWDARLVVLSACESLAGPLYAGEGLMGLARAFLAGGAETVVATQWPVGPSSAELMTRFYAGLASGADAGAALRAARRSLRDDPRTAHPFHWASFVIVVGR